MREIVLKGACVIYRLSLKFSPPPLPSPYTPTRFMSPDSAVERANLFSRSREVLKVESDYSEQRCHTDSRACLCGAAIDALPTIAPPLATPSQSGSCVLDTPCMRVDTDKLAMLGGLFAWSPGSYPRMNIGRELGVAPTIGEGWERSHICVCVCAHVCRYILNPMLMPLSPT